MSTARRPMTDQDATALNATAGDDPARRVRIRPGTAGFPRGAAGRVISVDPASGPDTERVHVAVHLLGVADVLPFTPGDLLIRDQR